MLVTCRQATQTAEPDDSAGIGVTDSQSRVASLSPPTQPDAGKFNFQIQQGGG